MGNQLTCDFDDKKVKVEPDDELENNSTECNICRPFQSQNEVDKHMEIHYITKYYCLSCYNIYETEQQFQEHFINNYHLKIKCDIYYCKFCMKDFVSKANLMQHLQLWHIKIDKDRSKIRKESKAIQANILD